ncbi:DUF3592 domain-containing protein [Simiduia curdlanivorans]|uniref:DUF3592 domain-containing protein n=1 Tax=Simiduia curdlanivorans TaxID=1492769 RepID=A0ABV8V1D7_9GAMM|nr:DUF3592 domain-containing protein [Simiduia curdlanivorans]MDN3637817.1 DUF3592 domain-containing protein [Simiduia curdlanivorans]
MAVDKKTKQASPLFLILFALPFAGVGVGFLFFSIIPSLYEWQQMHQWQPVDAQLLSAKLQTNHGDDSTTYQALASYRYYFRGTAYESDRVGIMSGSDNIGSWQEDKAYELKRALAKGGSISVYVDPDKPDQAVVYRELRWGMLGFKLIFVVVFGGVGVGLIFFSFYQRNKIAPNLTATDEPWLANEDWHNPIRSNAKAGLWGAWIFAIFWNAVSSPIPFVLPEELAKGNYPALIGLLFPIVGIGLLIWAISATRQWQRFGPSPLLLNPYPGAIGGQVGGEVDMRLPYDASMAVAVTLACVHSYYSGSGKDRSRRESVQWQKDGFAQVSASSQGTKVAFCFDVPSKLPASQLSDDSYYFWRLSLHADLPGADFDRDYEIPVFPGTAQSSLALTDASQHPIASVERGKKLEALLNARQLPDGVELNYGYFRGALGKAIGAIFGSGFFAGGVFMWPTDAPTFMAVCFMLVGGLIALACLYGLFNAYQVKIGKRGIFTVRKLCGVIVGKRFIAPEKIRHLEIESRGSSQVGKKTTQHFVINAKLTDGSKHRVVESLDGRAMAEEALESVSMLSGIQAKKS